MIQEKQPLAAFGQLVTHVAPGHEWQGEQRDLSPPHHLAEHPFEPASLKGRHIGAVLTPHQGKHTRRILRHDESASLPGATYHQPLYLLFAELQIRDFDQIARFADTYGLLGRPTQYEVPNAKGARRYIHGEPWMFWAIEVHRMRTAIRLREKVRADPMHAHSSRIDLKKDPHLREFKSVLEMREEGAQTLAQIGIQRPSRLERIINTQLASLHAVVVTDRTGRLHLELKPPSLLSFLWLQCALSADAGTEIRKCDECPRYFEVGEYGDARTRRKIHCSDRCRVRASRARQRQTSASGSTANTKS